uniref:Uncharacterized protein n=1 Tax=Oryza nivara TaxID=4536 RepID=A0A0E0J6H3_ORYNI
MHQETRLRKLCHHGGHDIQDAAIAHLKDVVFTQRSSPRKGEGNPRQRPKEITTPEDVVVAGPVNHRTRLSPGTLQP